jgi:selenocysteine lyase/cysteine desulfurase
MVRISFGMYNTINEVNEFLNVLEYIIRKHLY